MYLRTVIIAILVLGLSSTGAFSQKKKDKTTNKDMTTKTEVTATPNASSLKSNRDTLAYALGLNWGKGLLMQMAADSLNFNIELMLRGITDGLLKSQPSITDDQMRTVLTAFQGEMQAKQEVKMKAEEAKKAASATENKQKGQAFLAENAKKEGVKSLPSGLQYKVEKEGTGKSPKAVDTVKVHYTGKLVSGKVFDSSVDRGEPISFPLNRVIKGWTEGLQLMKEGSKYTFYIPSDLAYGEQGMGGAIGPNEVLIFDVELLQVSPASASQGNK